MVRYLVWGLALIAIMIAGCSSDEPAIERRGGNLPVPTDGGADTNGGGASNADNLVPYCDALRVVQNKCQRCHGDPLRNGAPVAFLSFETFQSRYSVTSDVTWREVALSVVELDVMPYLAPNDPPTSLMPPVEPLSAEEKATLLGWLEQGAEPAGGASCP